jgi:CheY-like chemotaxis protein
MQHTLLVVDDSEINRDMLRRRLERKGYRVITAENGEQALELVSREAIDLVLLDVMMPGLSGLDVLRILRKTPAGKDLPVIMATARSDSTDIVEALDAGANDYVIKPLDVPVVIARVEAQLRSRTATAPPLQGAAAEPTTDTVLAGKYLLESVIGSGAFGSVYRARHLGLDHRVAVKVLKAGSASSPEAAERFRREGVAACRVRHPNAVTVMDFGVTAGGAPFLVMELLDGRSLDAEIERAAPMPASRCAEIVVPLCGVLAEAHQVGILHRDIKPANVFLHKSRVGEMVKVLDFGIAKLLDAGQSLTVEGGIVGTPAYMAPERFRGATLDGKADVYSIGVLLYQMLSGRLPFQGPDADLLAVAMMHLNEDPPPLKTAGVSAAVEDVVRAALAKDPAHRPGALDLGVALALASGMAVTRPEDLYPAALEVMGLPDTDTVPLARTFGTLQD